MGYFTNCSSDLQNVKIDDCPGFGTVAGMLVLPPDFEITDEATARTYATWEAAMQAIKTERLYPVNLLHAFDDQSEETMLADGITGKVFVKSGVDTYNMTFASSPYRHATLKTLEGRRSIFLFDVNGNIRGTSPDGVKLEAMNVKISVGNHKVNNGTDPGRTVITVSFEETDIVNRYPSVLSDLNFKPQNFEGLQTVDLSVVSGSVSGAVVSVVDKFSGAAALGLEAADFLIKNVAGVAQTVTSAVDNEDGTYNIVYTVSAGTYTFDLKQPKDMTTKGYESSKAVSKVLA